MELYGKQYTKEQLMQYADINPTREFCYEAGPANGIRAVSVTTGSGLCFIVLKDRALGIGDATFQGVPVGYQPKMGLNASSDFLRAFNGGLLTTCGMANAGAPCTDEGKEYPQHGNLSFTPAYDVGVSSDWQGDELVTTITGKMKEARLFGENIVLHRTIESRYGQNTIRICDTLENHSFEHAECMLLYHINFGFPFFNHNAKLTTNGTDIIALNDWSDVTKFDRFDVPTAGWKQECFAFCCEKDGMARLENNGVFAQIDFNLPYLVEWKQIGQGDYVLALEPSTSKRLSRPNAREDGTFVVLNPLETVQYQVSITFGTVTP